MAAVIVIAHEYGHHIQALHQRIFKAPIGIELQADCYAGQFLAGADEGQLPLQLHPGDVAAALHTIRSIADTEFSNTSWFQPGKHGGTAERAQAIATGFITGDARFCESYEHTGPIVPVDIGNYCLLPLPASDVTALSAQQGVHITSSTISELRLDAIYRTEMPSKATAAVTAIFENASATPIGDPQPFTDAAGHQPPAGATSTTGPTVSSTALSSLSHAATVPPSP